MAFTRQIAFPELAALATDDGQDRFADLVARQSRFVFRVAYAVLRNVHDAEDAVQDLFLKLHRSGAWREMNDEHAFLARAAWRMAVDKLPSRRQGAIPELAAPSHERDVIASDLQATVHRLVDSLPEEFRQPLVLSAIEELTSRQIAEVMGIPDATVRSRIMRARQMLKEKLAARLGGAQ